MNIEARVRDYRGCERADLELGPIALLAGRNGSGKTSFAQAIASVLTGEALPMRGVAKSNAGVLVRTGHESGAATVQTDSGTARMDWPACTRRTDKEPPEASRYAAGLTSVVDLPSADRARVLAEYLKADPTREDLALAIADHHELRQGTDVTAQVWELIERSNWDGALSARRERGAGDKGRWRQITGQNYGSRIAASWRNDLDDDRRSDAELVALVEAAQRAHEHAVGLAGASSGERARLRELADQVGERAAALDAAGIQIEERERELAAATQARESLPPAVARQPEVSCPECGAVLIIRPGSLLEPATLQKSTGKTVDEGELKKRRLAIADADGTAANRRDALGLAQRVKSEAEAALREAQAAKSTLAAMPPETGEAVDTIATRSALEAAQQRLTDVRAKRQADEIAKRIADNELIIDLLAPEGLRGRKLGRVIEAFNDNRLAPLCTAAGWRPVTINAHFELAYGGRHYSLLSQSEQFRVRVVLQVAMAQLDDSAAMIIDAADILDGPARGDLIELLVTANIPTIVCMTLGRRELAPALSDQDIGRTYWMEDGIVTALDQPAAVAA